MAVAGGAVVLYWVFGRRGKTVEVDEELVFASPRTPFEVSCAKADEVIVMLGERAQSSVHWDTHAAPPRSPLFKKNVPFFQIGPHCWW